MATSLADKCDTKCLLLNHFSQRYRPKSTIESKPTENKENLSKKQKKEKGDGEEEGDEDEDITTDLLLQQAKQATSKPVYIA
jgi:ribonuclease BN (tRNA processing enzyme)